MLEDLKQRVCKANLDLVAQGLVVQTFGNVSGIDARREHVAIKPSGVPYDNMRPEQMVILSLASGKVVEGDLRPSSDTPTHLALYRAFAKVGGIVHTHSMNATAWAQALREIPPLGTTHADYFPGLVPLTRGLSKEEIAEDYEGNTGKVIIDRFAKLDPLHFPAVLVAHHGPFTWGETPDAAVKNAAILEYLADLARRTVSIQPHPLPVSQAQLDKHFNRKHGPNAYYGQEKR